MQRKFFVTVETDDSVMEEVVTDLKNAVMELNEDDDVKVTIADARSNSFDGDKRFHGKVKVWFEDKGYGFIIPDNYDKDLFVHLTGLDGLESLQPDQQVEYSLSKGRKGLQAVQVRTI